MSAGRALVRGEQLSFEVLGPFPHVEAPAPSEAVVVGVDLARPTRIMVDQIIKWPDAPRPFHNGSCHLTCDGPIEELHAFAKRIGLRRSWFQEHASMPHYDLTPRRRERALKAGAVFVEAREQARARRAARQAAASSS